MAELSAREIPSPHTLRSCTNSSDWPDLDKLPTSQSAKKNIQQTIQAKHFHQIPPHNCTMDDSLYTLLTSLTISLASASTSLPESSLLIPPKAGISLLDVKNELLLSYLHNLVFLILIKLRHSHSSNATPDDNVQEDHPLEDDVVKTLVELRVYLEKGVRPLEGRLKYQIDKVLRVAEDAAAARDAAAVSNDKVSGKTLANGNASKPSSASDDGDEGSAEEDASAAQASTIDELSYRPNPASLQRRSQAAKTTSSATAATASNDGVYRPPRITPTAQPAAASSSTTSTGRSVRARGPAKSATLDEFLATELAAAPVPVPSVGSTIAGGGRRGASAQERASAAERRTYEEANFVRLPKEARKKGKRGGAAAAAGYGGEDWRGLGEGADRIERLTRGHRERGGAGPGKSALERSRKRGLDGGEEGAGGKRGRW